MGKGLGMASSGSWYTWGSPLLAVRTSTECPLQQNRLCSVAKGSVCSTDSAQTLHRQINTGEPKAYLERSLAAQSS